MSKSMIQGSATAVSIFSPSSQFSRIAIVCALLAATIVTGGAWAQYAACVDTLALFSPQNLSIRFEPEPVPGTRLVWDEFAPELTSCFRMTVPADLAARVQPELEGDYTAIYDREITLRFSDAGTIGATNTDLVRVVINNTHPNPDIPSLAGVFNLSNRGGIFRVDVGASNAVATQSNVGLPNHLERTNITSIAVWSAADNSSHRIYAAMDNVPLVRSDDGGLNWVETAAGGVDPIRFPITHLAVSPGNRDLIFAGTSNAGLWVSRDGGVTFGLADSAIRPATTFAGTTVLRYLKRPGGGSRLFMGMSGIGFFFSDDDGVTWNRLTSLRVPPGRIPLPNNTDRVACPDDAPAGEARVLALAQSLNDPNVIYAGVNTWGVYRSADGGASWTRANDDLVYCTGDTRRSASVNRLLVLDDGGSDRLVAGTDFLGIWVSLDDGQNWIQASGVPTNSQTGNPVAMRGFIEFPAGSLRLLGGTPADGLVESTDGGLSWAPLAFGPSVLYTQRIGALAANPVFSDEILVGTVGAGTYRPGEPVDLSRALAPAQGPHAGKDLSFGLSIRFAAGSVQPDESMTIFGQSFQGYAVWRAVDYDLVTGEPNWQLIGLYDRINPESCSTSGCDELSPDVQLGCFANKRANCFQFNPDRTVEFFDREVFSGFTYQYAVTSFDYLFGGRVSPANFAGEMWFSPRSPLESAAESRLFRGFTPFGAGPNYNMKSFQVNRATAANLDRVYVVPNPLRRQAGWDFGDQSSLRFFNVTPSSTCEIYTLAGDLVARLGNVVDEGVQKGIIEWNTRNQSGEFVASGVYIYRITNATGEELIDRFTIIR